uniref:AMP-dependent synthetase/ligase domain-containing protein n=1 Tax=Hucho hucho TaxID=62062 RepID=A0A4W5L5L8_9TELE
MVVDAPTYVAQGPTVFSGYYKEPEKTAEALDGDGWLRTGDIGVWTTDGRLKLVDRKTNIFKLAQGEYVAAEKIENVLQSSSLVNQAFVYGDSFRSSLVAIIVPDEIALSALAASLQLGGSLADWCRHPEVHSSIRKDVSDGYSKQEGLLGFEMVRAVQLEPMPFSVENGLLTPTFKLKRHDAKALYAKVIDPLYASSGDVTHVASLG